MSLLPPFKIKDRKAYEHLVDELKESVEDFFLGFETPMAVEFKSIGLMEKKRPFVYLSARDSRYYSPSRDASANLSCP